MKIAICVVTFNRLKSLKRLIKSIYMAEYDSLDTYDLIISIDYSGSDEIYNYCKSLNWNHGNLIIKQYKKNLGLKKHILKCGNYVQDYDGIVLLEDDLIVSKAYLSYIKQILPLCEKKDNVAGISLYTYECNEFADFRFFSPLKIKNDIYFMKIPSSWGEFWTKQQWNDFVMWMENKYEPSTSYDVPAAVNNWGDQSWKKIFSYYMVQTDKYFIYPYYGYSTNMGDKGEHNVGSSNVMQCRLMEETMPLTINYSSNNFVYYDQFMENENIAKLFQDTTIDIYGTKSNYNRYVISTKKMNYKILKSWKLGVKPFELNIIKDITGNSLFLYDTYINETNKNKNSVDIFMSYYPFTKNTIKKFSNVIIKECISKIKKVCISKIK